MDSSRRSSTNPPSRTSSPEGLLVAFQRRFFFLARRFVAGENAQSAMDAIAALNAEGFLATLDFLGEDVTRRDEALRTKGEYLALLETIRARGVQTNVSVKLSAMGLLVDEDFARANIRDIVVAAQRLDDSFVRIDMEGSACVDPTLRIFERLFPEHRNLGIVLQAYLKRTPADVARAIELGARVRLCKGAYREPPAIAYKTMADIRAAYLLCAEALLKSGVYPGIATHDESLIAGVQALASQASIGKDRFEFQMLYGIRPAVQRRLVAQGYRVRIYVPYGTRWAAYFYRRITERKENAYFVLRSLLKK
jgi:proline dehydrogenase